MPGPIPPTEHRIRDRFTVVRLLGAGGMGTVYDTIDRRLGRRCAVKSLKHFSGQGLYRFKREFRSLAELRHRNLVRLGELHGEGTDWFFTMELVEGIDWLSYVRGRDVVSTDHADEETVEGNVGRSDAIASPRAAHVVVYDEARLRATLVQIATALRVLHEHGKIHRDLKPSNVLVTAAGRVVLLDFGLVVDADQEASLRRTEMHVVGTASYMSPEQASAKPTTEATDWYALGVMLFEALTGGLPFSGNPYVMLTEKVSKAAPRPSELRETVPEDLDELCHALLATRPEDRPPGADVLERLHAGKTSLEPDPDAFPMDEPFPFLGRTRELECLRAAFATAERGHPASVLIVGEPGIGKTALVERFAEELLATRPDVVVLRGRCRAHELVPFRAFDGVVDELSHHLRTVPESTLSRWLDDDVASLGRVFPVLERVDAIGRRMERTSTLGASEVRAQAFRSLRSILRSIHDDRPLVLVMEDLQWTDPDSVQELSELLGGDEVPGMLVVATSRPVPRMEQLANPDAIDLGLPPWTRLLELDRLDEASTRQLLGSAMPEATPEAIDSGLSTSRGHPLHALEIARASLRPRAAEHGSLEDVAWERVHRLDETRRRLLFTIAIAGVPLDETTLAAACELELGPTLEALSELLERHFVIIHETMQGPRWDLHHERVATMIRMRVPAEEAFGLRQRIVAALLASEAFASRHDLIAAQLLAVGERAAAARHFISAAHAAETAGAFARAAETARLAVETSALHQRDRLAMHDLGARCLHVAGYLPEAGAEYLRAAEHTTDRLVRARLLASAAHAYASNYDAERATTAAADALALIGDRLPDSRLRRVLALVWFATRAGVNAAFKRRDPRPEDDLTRRLRVIHSVYFSLGIVSYVRSDRMLTLIALFAILYSGRMLGPSRELIKTEHTRGMIAASVGNERVIRRQIARIRSLGRVVDDRWVPSSVGFATVLLLCIIGRFAEAEDEATRTELAGTPLDAFEHLAMTTRIGLVLGLQGRHRQALGWFRRGLGRLSPSIDNAFVRSVRTSEAFQRAMLDEDASFGARVDEELASSELASASTRRCLGLAMIHALALEPTSERAARLLEWERAHLPGGATVSEEAHMPVVMAGHLRLAAHFVSPSPRSTAAFRASVARARAFGRWPMLRPHVLVLEAAERLVLSDLAGARELAGRALELAETGGNAFAGFEACRLLARIEHRAGNEDAMNSRLEEARFVAAGHGWASRARQLDADELALRRPAG